MTIAPTETRARREWRTVDGILLLDKHEGASSNSALQAARRLFGARKAGHTGNLDVLATGLLPLCFGEATKVCQFLLDADKTYEAEITFGQETSTGDREGRIVWTGSTAGITATQVAAAMLRFVGDIEQVPPMHSALKRDGQPLYRLARQGLTVERPIRPVHIHAFNLEACEMPRARVSVRCSKGTYIRTLAEDLGRALGCGAHVTRLRRLRAGPFSIEHSVTLERLTALAPRGAAALDGLLLSPDSALVHLPSTDLGADAARRLAHGQAVTRSGLSVTGTVRVYAHDGRFIGVCEARPDRTLVPQRLFGIQASESKGESRHPPA